jgi:hypothetical protein
VASKLATDARFASLLTGGGGATASDRSINEFDVDDEGGGDGGEGNAVLDGELIVESRFDEGALFVWNEKRQFVRIVNE